MSKRTLVITGPAANNFFAQALIDRLGEDEAKNRVGGPMLKAVEREIARRQLAAQPITAPDRLQSQAPFGGG